MNNIKLSIPKKLLGLLYYCVLTEMQNVDRNTPSERADDLQKLEIILSKYL